MTRKPGGKRVVFDFEFVPGNPCLPISVALEDVDSGNTLYCEWPEAEARANSNPWLAANVAPHLDAEARSDEPYIAAAIRKFLRIGKLADRDDLQLYASCGAYDFFLLSETLGGFSRSGLPYTYYEMAHMGLPEVDRLPGEAEHNALADVAQLARALRIHFGTAEVPATPPHQGFLPPVQEVK